MIVLADGGSVALAVDAMRAGASDFLVKPVAPERLLEALAANGDRRRAEGELAPLSEKLAPDPQPRGIDRRRARFPQSRWRSPPRARAAACRS